MSSTTRVRLLRHAPTPATRAHRFATDEALDPVGQVFAASLDLGQVHESVVSAPSRRCLQTAAAVAPHAEVVGDARWGELDFGRWSGLTMEQVWERDRDGLQAWLDDPSTAPTGGEPFGHLAERVAEALDSLRGMGGEHLVVTSAGPIKAAVLRALDAPVASVWKVDVAPGSVTSLEADASSGWRVRSLNVPAEVAR